MSQEVTESGSRHARQEPRSQPALPSLFSALAHFGRSPCFYDRPGPVAVAEWGQVCVKCTGQASGSGAEPSEVRAPTRG